VDRFVAQLEAAHAQVLRVSATDWPRRLAQVLAEKGAARLLFAPATEAGRTLAEAKTGLELIAYDQAIEAMKDTLVSGVDAGLTTALAGIAHTGSLVLWPTEDEPRLMSLLPPIHVALIHEGDIVDSLPQAMERGQWATAMPTNLVLVSGPSKTADIEQTLAYGVHGPKELIVLLAGP
jgi:L-lactate dehydrogenase complex protein LldG